jgi:hypothetical protein
MHPIAVASYLGGMVSRRASLGLVALLVVGLTGCSGAPAPDPSGSPSPAATGFASEDEAFAAAEETYRAYVDEMNAYYAGEDDADPNAFLSGGTLASAKDLHEQEETLGLSVSGAQRVLSVAPKDVTVVEGTTSVDLTVCMDISDTRVLDANGKDVTPERVEVRALDVQLATVQDRLLIVASVTNDDAQC